MISVSAGQPRPLPIRPRPVTGESIASYIRRLARANHLRPGYLRRYLRQPGAEGTIRLEWLAILAGRPLDVLAYALADLPARHPLPGHPKRLHRQPIRRHTRQADKPGLFAAIRRDAHDKGLSIRALSDRHGVHRRTVRHALALAEPPPRKKPRRRSSRLDPFRAAIDAMLQADLHAPENKGHTVKKIYDRLSTEYGMTGVSYGRLRDYVALRRPPARSRTMRHNQ